MPEFVVSWEIDIDADDQLSAAKIAEEIMRDHSIFGNIFDVVDEDGRKFRVDLGDNSVVNISK